MSEKVRVRCPGCGKAHKVRRELRRVGAPSVEDAAHGSPRPGSKPAASRAFRSWVEPCSTRAQEPRAHGRCPHQACTQLREVEEGQQRDREEHKVRHHLHEACRGRAGARVGAPSREPVHAAAPSNPWRRWRRWPGPWRCCRPRQGGTAGSSAGPPSPSPFFYSFRQSQDSPGVPHGKTRVTQSADERRHPYNLQQNVRTSD